MSCNNGWYRKDIDSLIWGSSCLHFKCYSVVVSLYEGDVLGGRGMSGVKSPACCFEWRGRGILREEIRKLSSRGRMVSFDRRASVLDPFDLGSWAPLVSELCGVEISRISLKRINLGNPNNPLVTERLMCESYYSPAEGFSQSQKALLLQNDRISCVEREERDLV